MLPHRMTLIDATRQQIEREPPALILERCLICKTLCAVHTTKIFCLDKLHRGNHFTHRFYRSARSQALIHDSIRKVAPRPTMRIPVTIQRREACRRQWLVDRSYISDLRIALCNSSRVIRELPGKPVIEQARVPGTAAVMNETHDGSDSVLLEQLHPFIGPAPVCLARRRRSGSLPQDRIANRSYAERCNSLDV